MNVRTIGNSRPMKTVAARARRRTVGQLDLVLTDQEVPTVALEERPAAVRTDGVRDERPEGVPDRRDDTTSQ